MIDSHALVGSCAQVGKNCHISAASQIGGVLEPVGAMPVIVEDEVLVGGNCGIYEGVIVKRRAVLGTGTILNASTPVYDLVRSTVYRATAEQPLVIPEEAVIVAGSRAVTSSARQGMGYFRLHSRDRQIPRCPHRHEDSARGFVTVTKSPSKARVVHYCGSNSPAPGALSSHPASRSAGLSR